MNERVMSYSEWRMLNEANAKFDVEFNRHTQDMEFNAKDAVKGFSYPLEIVKFSEVRGRAYRDSVNLRAEMTNGDKFHFYANDGDSFYKLEKPDGSKSKHRISDQPESDTPFQTFLKLVRAYYDKRKKEKDEA